MEITSTRTYFEAKTGERVLQETFLHSLDKFVQEVETRAAAEGTLRGYYLIHSFRPPTRLKKKHRALLEGALDYIRSTQAAESSEEVPLDPDDPHSARIAKWVSTPDAVEHTSSDGGWQIEIRETATELIRSLLIDKSRKLSNKCISEPRVLVIQNSYAITMERDFQDASHLVELQDYHTVFLRLTETQGIFLKDGFAGPR